MCLDLFVPICMYLYVLDVTGVFCGSCCKSRMYAQVCTRISMYKAEKHNRLLQDQKTRPGTSQERFVVPGVADTAAAAENIRGCHSSVLWLVLLKSSK